MKEKINDNDNNKAMLRELGKENNEKEVSNTYFFGLIGGAKKEKRNSKNINEEFLRMIFDPI